MSRADLFKKQSALRERISGRPLVHSAADPAAVEALLNSKVDADRIAALDYFAMMSVNYQSLAGEDLALIEGLEQAFERNRLDAALTKAQRDVIGAIAGPLGLGHVLAVHETIGDKDGGNVTTIHNAQQGIYAREEDEYRRKEYTGSKNSQGNKFEGDSHSSVGSTFTRKQMDQNNHVTDGYTGEILKADKTSPDHIVSNSAFHKSGGFMLSETEKADFATDEGNLVLTRRDINQSMRDHDKEEWGSRKSNDREVTNSEYFEIDPVLMKDVLKRGKETAEKHAPTTGEKARFYATNAASTGVNEGFKFGAQQVFGIVIVEFFSAATLELKDMYQCYKDKRPLFDEVGARLTRVGMSVATKWEGMIKGFGHGFISGFISNAVTVIINMVCTTGRRVVRMIREGVFSLLKALRMFIFTPEGMTPVQAAHEGLKILGAGGVLIGGLALEEVLETFIKTFPPLIPYAGQLTAIFIGASTAICMVFACYLLDKLDLFGAISLERDKYVIKELDDSIAQRITTSKAIIEEIERYMPTAG